MSAADGARAASERRAALLVLAAVLDPDDGEQLAQHAAHEVVYHAGNGKVLAGLVDLTARLLIERHGSRAEAVEHCRALLAQTYQHEEATP